MSKAFIKLEVFAEIDFSGNEKFTDQRGVINLLHELLQDKYDFLIEHAANFEDFKVSDLNSEILQQLRSNLEHCSEEPLFEEILSRLNSVELISPEKAISSQAIIR